MNVTIYIDIINSVANTLKSISQREKVDDIQLNQRQLKIIEIVKQHQPITSENIAANLNLTRATLRSDLAILTMIGILDARPKVGYFYLGENKLILPNKEIKNKKIEEIMSSPILIKQDVSIYDSIITMFLSDVGSIFIIDENEELCGIVSRKDLLKASLGGSDINKLPIGMIMTRTPNVVTVHKEDNVLNAAKKIIEHEVDAMPVVELIDDNRNKLKVVGRISKTSITKLFLELLDT